MTSNIPIGHPYWNAKLIVEAHLNEISTLYFSYYDYIPQSLIDRRKIFTISPQNFLDSDFIESVFKNTPINQELAFHSKILATNGVYKHIPMIDMSTGSTAQLAKLKPFLGEDTFHDFKWFKSGRSFHGYGNILLSEKEWVEFMGKLLLANQKGLAPTVDPRWVGHRLIAGYSALRWTKNTNYYLSLPNSIN